MRKGLVLKSTGSWYTVLSNGKKYEGRLRGKLKLKGEKYTNPLAVGDNVLFEEEEKQEGQIVITERLTRSNFLIRKAVKQSARGHVIAANLDQILIVATLSLPKTSTGFIDRVLASAESFRIPTVIAFNKQDLLDPKHIEKQEQYIDLYSSLGTTCVKTSAQSGEGIEALEQLLLGKKTVLSGQSGVGKSSILNYISKDLQLKIGEVSNWSEKGKHTTTFAEMFALSTDTYVIDTPGIREFGLIDIEDWELADYFTELRALRNHCKFHNCTHMHEPGCYIKQAVEDGEIAQSRYNSYVKMMQE